MVVANGGLKWGMGADVGLGGWEKNLSSSSIVISCKEEQESSVAMGDWVRRDCSSLMVDEDDDDVDEDVVVEPELLW